MKVFAIFNIIVFTISVNLGLHCIKYCIECKHLSDKILWGLMVLMNLSNICVIISLYA